MSEKFGQPNLYFEGLRLEKAKAYFLVISWPEVRNISNVSAGEKPPSDGQRAYLRQFFNHFIPSGFLEAVKQDSRAGGADALVK